MKVKIGPYVGFHTTSFHENYMEAKYGNRFADSSDSLDYYVEVVDATIQWVYDHTINLYLNKKERSVKVHIHKYDTWSMDETLAYIVLPMLKQLRTDTHGSPLVEAEDVPDEEMDVHSRWDWVLGEMIFAFESKHNGWEEQFHSGEMDFSYVERDDGFGEMVKGPNDTHKFDSVGHEEYQSRITNGFKLFGKYYEGLWD